MKDGEGGVGFGLWVLGSWDGEVWSVGAASNGLPERREQGGVWWRKRLKGGCGRKERVGLGGFVVQTNLCKGVLRKEQQTKFAWVHERSSGTLCCSDI